MGGLFDYFLWENIKLRFVFLSFSREIRAAESPFTTESVSETVRQCRLLWTKNGCSIFVELINLSIHSMWQISTTWSERSCEGALLCDPFVQDRCTIFRNPTFNNPPPSRPMLQEIPMEFTGVWLLTWLVTGFFWNPVNFMYTPQGIPVKTMGERG